MMSFTNDLRYALRMLSKNPGFTAVAALTLALGIGANTAVFSMADAILFRPYPFKNLDRIVSLWETVPRVSAEQDGVSPGNYFEWEEQSQAFAQMTAYQGWSATLTGARSPEPVEAYRVAPGFFSLLDVSPLKGRYFSRQIRAEDANQVVVSYGFWQNRMGADPNAPGKTIALNGLVVVQFENLCG